MEAPQFGYSKFDNIDVELSKIQQTSTIADYISRFQQLSDYAHNLTERQLLVKFVEGLRSNI